MSSTHFFLRSILLLMFLFFILGGASSFSTKKPIDYWNHVLPKTAIPSSILYFLNTGVKKQFHLNNNLCMESKDINWYDYFLEKDLKVQESSMYLHFHRTAPMGGFVPRSVANSIPISSENLPNILKSFLVELNSLTANMIKQTIKICEEQPSMLGEKRICASSLESMIDFATSVLETPNVNAISTNVSNRNGNLKQSYSITSTSLMEGTQSRSVICHPYIFPYAMFYCHSVPNTKIYSSTLVGENGSKIEAFAVCHEDTSQWNPKHISLKVLKVKPGETSVCHFLAEDNVVWTASNPSTNK